MRWIRTLAAASVVGALFATAGCGGGTTQLRLASLDNPTALAPQWISAVYRKVDSNTADIFISDVAEEDLLSRLEAGAAGPPATVLYIRLFIMPKAGYTPIDYTASNCTITQVVFTGASMGIYGGGGFMLPDQSKLGRDRLDGEIRGASMRLMRTDPGFADRLGQSELSGVVSARKDGQLVRKLSAAFARLIES